MTTTKHTPGPWTSCFLKGAARGFVMAGMKAGDKSPGTTVAAVCTEADAALIAAAPTMLDELKHAWAVFNAQDSAYMQGQAGSIARLIAKITGEPWGHFNPDGSYRDFEAAVEAHRMERGA